MEKNYRLVRFEDLATKPEVEARRLYDFVGLDYNAAVQSWIRSNTKSTGNARDDTNFPGNTRPDTDAAGNARTNTNFTGNTSVAKELFSTRRNSRERVEGWRRELQAEESIAIQDACGSDLLVSLGYELNAP